MRVALVSETFLPKVDGIVNTRCHLLTHLGATDHESVLFAPLGGPARYARPPVVGLPAVPFPLYPEVRVAWPGAVLPARLVEFAPDLVPVLNPSRWASPPSAMLADLVSRRWQRITPTCPASPPAGAWASSPRRCGPSSAGCTARPI